MNGHYSNSLKLWFSGAFVVLVVLRKRHYGLPAACQSFLAAFPLSVSFCTLQHLLSI